MASRFQFSLRLILELIFILAAAVTGYQAVYWGEAHRWPGFQLREGYWGTNFLRDILYAIGEDTVVLRIVSGIWFGYAAILALGVVIVVRLCLGRASDPGTPSGEDSTT